MLQKFFVFIFIFATIGTAGRVSSGFVRPQNDTSPKIGSDYQYIANTNSYYNFVQPTAMSQVTNGNAPATDIVVADKLSSNPIQTEVVRFGNISALGSQQGIVQVSSMGTLDYSISNIAVVQQNNALYLYTLEENTNTFRIHPINNGVIDKQLAAYENISDFEAYNDFVYLLQNQDGKFKIRRITLSNSAGQDLIIPNLGIGGSTEGSLTQLAIVSPRPTNITQLSYFVAHSSDANNFELRKIEANNALPDAIQFERTSIANMSYQNDQLFYSTNSALNIINTNSLNLAHRSVQVMAAKFIDGVVYFATQSDGIRMQSIDTSNIQTNQIDTLLQSNSNNANFYDRPNAVVSRTGRIYVADTYNNRIAVLGDQSTQYQSLSTNAISIATNRSGTMFALRYSNSGSFVDVFESQQTTPTTTIVVPQRLNNIAIDALDNLFGFVDNQILQYNGSSFEILQELSNPIIALNTAPDRLGVYAMYQQLDGFAISHIQPDNVNDNKINIGKDRPTSFAVDFDNNYFALFSNGDLRKYNAKGQFQQTKNISLIKTGGTMDMAISMADITVATGQQINAGDLLITHKNSNALIGISAAFAGVFVPDWNEVQHPTIDDSSSSAAILDSTIQTITQSTALYTFPTELKASDIVVDAGERIILIDQSYSEIYSYIMLDITHNIANTPIVGYVLTSLLTVGQNDIYVQPLADNATVINSSPLFRYPTESSVRLDINPTKLLEGGTKVKLLDFAKYTVNGYTWLKVEYQSEHTVFVGFVLSHNLNIGDFFRPGGTKLPRTNATVKGTGVTGLMPISTTNNRQLQFFVPVGTRVHVVGTFNIQKDTTTIEYFDEEYNGVLTVEVPTSSLEYDNITVMQVSAFFIAVVMIALMIIAVAIYKHKKSQSMLTDNVYEFEADSDDVSPKR